MLFLVLLIAVAVAGFLYWTWNWELKPCPRCNGRGRGRLSRPKAYNRRCGRCGGQTELIRPLSLIWPRHREEARRRREARKGR